LLARSLVCSFTCSLVRSFSRSLTACDKGGGGGVPGGCCCCGGGGGGAAAAAVTAVTAVTAAVVGHRVQAGDSWR